MAASPGASALEPMPKPCTPDLLIQASGVPVMDAFGAEKF